MQAIKSGSKQQLAILGALTALGIFLRIFWVVHVPTRQLTDFATFLETASNIFYGYGHSLGGAAVAWVGPFYSYVLAAAHLLGGAANPVHAQILNVVLSLLTLGMAFFLFHKWFGGNWTKLLPAYGFTAVFPSLLAYNNVAGTETLFLFLVVGILLLQLYIPPKYWILQAVALGIVIALAALTKPFMLAYPAVVLAVRWIETKQLKHTLLATGVVFLAMAVTIAPWTVRNYRHFDRVVVISYNRGYNQFVNNNDANTHGRWMYHFSVPMSNELRARMEESLAGGRTVKQAYELEPYFADAASAWIRSNPRAFGQLMLLRVQQTFFAGANDIPQWTMNDFAFSDEYGNLQNDEYGNPRFAELREFRFFAQLFDINQNVFSAAGLLFALLTVIPYAKTFFCKTKKRDMPIGESMTFINIAFFVVIVAFFEGQVRYAHSVVPFFIFALVWLCLRKKPDAKLM